jgi:hypothetical protein
MPTRPASRHVLRLGLLILAACVVTAGEVEARPPKGFAYLLKALPDGRPVTVLEGLPHPGAEREAFEAERARPHVVIDGQHLYEAPIFPPAGESAAVAAWLRTPGALLPWEGEKKCGGFHTDVAFATNDGGHTWHVHLCLGCGEALVTGPRLKRPLRFELASDDDAARAKERVRGWRTQRPKPTHE